MTSADGFKGVDKGGGAVMGHQLDGDAHKEQVRRKGENGACALGDRGGL